MLLQFVQVCPIFPVGNFVFENLFARRCCGLDLDGGGLCDGGIDGLVTTG